MAGRFSRQGLHAQARHRNGRARGPRRHRRRRQRPRAAALGDGQLPHGRLRAQRDQARRAHPRPRSRARRQLRKYPEMGRPQPRRQSRLLRGHGQALRARRRRRKNAQGTVAARGRGLARHSDHRAPDPDHHRVREGLTQVSMIRLVGAEAVAERIGKADFAIVDPRRPMKYLMGHLSGAINLPVYRAFGDDGGLLEPAALAEWIGAGGVGDGVTPVLYDSPQGQNAAMLAWILSYLGAPEILVLDVFFERWKSEGRDVAYRPVPAPAMRRFVPRLNPGLRATLDEVRANTTDRLVDFRSREEFTGERDLDGTPGHLPHAVN